MGGGAWNDRHHIGPPQDGIAVRLTLRPLLFGLFAVLTGAFAMTLVWAIDSYHEFASAGRSATRAELIETLVKQQLTIRHEPKAVEFARIGASLPSWGSDVSSIGEHGLEEILAEAARQQLVTTGELALRELVVLDANMQRLASHSIDGQAPSDWETFREELSARAGLDARRIAARYLRDVAGGTVHLLAHPIGSFRVAGYLVVVTEPTNALPGMSEILDSRIVIETIGGRLVLDETPRRWKDESAAPGSIALEEITTIVQSDEGLPLYRMMIHSDESAYKREVAWLHEVSYLVAILVTLGGWLVGTLILRRTVFHRVSSMSAALRSIVAGDTSIELPREGPDEIGRMAGDLAKVADHVDRVLALKTDLTAKNALLNAQITEREKAEARIQFLAHYDELTKLPNRNLFRERIETELARSRESGKGLAILLLDLDRFKQFNDMMGHKAGDLLLQRVAARLSKLVREDDLVSRLGDDEFAIAQTGISDDDQSESLARRLIDELSRAFDISGREARINVSIGIATSGVGGHDAEHLLSCADLALWHAKSRGEGAFRLFEPSMEDLERDRRELEADLRRAIENQSFVLHYQPQFDITQDELRMVGVEALIRWCCPGRGMVPPSDFIPLAEKAGLIGAIGDWALARACADAAAWPTPLRVAVNLSPLQVNQSGLAEHVEHVLRTSGLRPDRLELEITEGVLLDDTDIVIETLRRIETLGVRIALDDFGTGFSTLSYLKKIRFDKLKIDKSFINDPRHTATNAPIVDMIIGLGRSLKIKVNAEGVETREQLEHLRVAGCDEVQGYYFSPAVPLEALEAMMDDGCAFDPGPPPAPVHPSGADQRQELSPVGGAA